MNALEILEAESAALLAAARAGLDAPVPNCPGWDVRALVGHLGQVQRFHAAHLVRGTTSRPDAPVPDVPADDEELLRWAADGTAVLLRALRETDPAAPAWTWAPHAAPVAAFWSRRMALEAAVHRWDAEAAHGVPQEVAPAVAADGVDEVLRVHLPADLPDEPGEVEGVVAVRLTDTGHGWTLRLRRDGVGDSDEAPTSVLSGTAHEVLLALWGRWPLEALVEGDVALAAGLRTA